MPYRCLVTVLSTYDLHYKWPISLHETLRIFHKPCSHYSLPTTITINAKMWRHFKNNLYRSNAFSPHFSPLCYTKSYQNGYFLSLNRSFLARIGTVIFKKLSTNAVLTDLNLFTNLTFSFIYLVWTRIIFIGRWRRLREENYL